MGGKKKGGKKGKKGKKGGGEFGLSLEESNAVLMVMKEALQARYIDEQQNANVCKAAEKEKREREMKLQRKVDEQKKTQMFIISDMTRQYKSVEEDLMNQINALERRKENNTQELKRLDETQRNIKTEIDDIHHKKKEQIDRLRNRINEMSTEFSTMLKDTLENMKKKIQ